MNRDNDQRKPNRKQQKRPCVSESGTNKDANIPSNKNHPLNKTEKAENVNDGKNGDGQNSAAKVHFYEKGQFWVNVFLAVFTLISLVMSYRASESANDLAEKQFEMANESYLEIKDISIYHIKIDEMMQVRYSIKNVGNQTIRTDSIGTYIYLTDTGNWSSQKLNIIKSKLIQMSPEVKYITKDNPTTFHDPGGEGTKTMPRFVEEIFNKNVNVYFRIDIIYRNMVTNKRSKYFALLQMFPSEDSNEIAEYRPIFNENVELGE